MKKIEIIPLKNKKDAQILEDSKMTPEQRWIRMWELIEFGLAFSPTKRLKVYDKNDHFITLSRKHAAA